MTELFILIAFSSIWILGLTIITQPYMALGCVRKWAEAKNKAIYEPLILCEWCMPTIHCLVGYAFAIGLGSIPASWRLIYLYPLTVMGTSIFVGFFWGVIKLIIIYFEYAEHKLSLTKHLEQLAFWDIEDRKAAHKNRSKNTFQSENHGTKKHKVGHQESI